MDDLAHRLERLGLARYTRLFAENDVDLDVLPHLTDDELKELGTAILLSRAVNEAGADCDLSVFDRHSRHSQRVGSVS